MSSDCELSDLSFLKLLLIRYLIAAVRKCGVFNPVLIFSSISLYRINFSQAKRLFGTIGLYVCMYMFMLCMYTHVYEHVYLNVEASGIFLNFSKPLIF